MMNAMLELMVLSHVTKSLSGFLGCSYEDDENRMLREKIAEQDRKIERLEDALVQVGTAVTQVGAAVYAQSQSQQHQHVAALPAHASAGKKVARFAKGEVLSGRVNKILDKGAHVAVKGYYGFLPIGQIAERWIGHPGEALHVGQKVRVKVIKIDYERDFVILSMKQCG